MKCNECTAKDECGLIEGLNVLLDHISDEQVQYSIKEIIDNYVKNCGYFEK